MVPGVTLDSRGHVELPLVQFCLVSTTATIFSKSVWPVHLPTGYCVGMTESETLIFSLHQLAFYSKFILKEIDCEWGECHAVLNCLHAVEEVSNMACLSLSSIFWPKDDVGN